MSKNTEKDSSQKLFAAAMATQKMAHAPYSGFHIGAALLTQEGKIFSGCNVENASYGATICAERVAIFKAVSEGPCEIKEILVLADGTAVWPPCGMCRQVISEFAKPDTKVFLANTEGAIKAYEFSEIFPFAFGAEFLK
jgi:cytidine deaminase